MWGGCGGSGMDVRWIWGGCGVVMGGSLIGAYGRFSENLFILH